MKNWYFIIAIKLIVTSLFTFFLYESALGKETCEPLFSYRFAPAYRISEVVNNPMKAKAFVRDYMLGEKNFFAIARDEKSGITYDGYHLDPCTGKAVKVRALSAPSKECLDIAILVKALEGNPTIALVMTGGDVKKAEKMAVDILAKKIVSYECFYRDFPGYGGFMPWILLGEKITPAKDWVEYLPSLDSGEWAWTLLLAEMILREKGYIKLADRYAAYNKILMRNVVKILYDSTAGKVRADVRICDIRSADSRYETASEKSGHLDFLSGEHGVHEGSMMVLYVSLFGKDLPDDAVERIWSSIAMKRVEHKYGTTWQGYYASAHESWAYLIIPFRDVEGYRQLFKIREIIRSQNAAERGYPGFATSAYEPGHIAYLDGAGIEGVASQPIRNNHMFVVYGAFPMLLHFATREHPYEKNIGLAWLLNMLKGNKMQGPLGAAESGSNDGKFVAIVKTIDGTFPNIIALAGGLEKETARMLRNHGVYDKFIQIIEHEYRETFGAELLREPVDFALPSASVPMDGIPDY